MPTTTFNREMITTTCGRQLDLSTTERVIERSNSLFSYNIHKLKTGERVIERSNSLFSYNIHKLKTGEYVIAEKFYANPFNNRYILLNDDQIELLKNL
jgi:hypothetical protein